MRKWLDQGMHKEESDFTKTKFSRPRSKSGMINFKFQCGACLALTMKSSPKPNFFKRVIIHGRCHDCGSTSVLAVSKTTEGICVESLEVKLTDLGRTAYYTLNPEKDPRNVQQNGNQNNYDAQQTTQDDASSDSQEALQGEDPYTET